MKIFFCAYMCLREEKNTFKTSTVYPVFLKAYGTFFGTYSKLFLNLVSLPIAGKWLQKRS